MAEDMRGVFLEESQEQLVRVQTLLLDAEERGFFSVPDIQELFRLIHTLKGSAGMMGYAVLSDAAHRTETVMARVRTRIEQNTPPDGTVFQTLITTSLSFCDVYLAYITRPDDGDAGLQIELLGVQLNLLMNMLPEPQDNADERGQTMQQPAVPEPQSDGCAQLRIFLKPCSMCAMRAFMIVRAVVPLCETVFSVPAELNRCTDAETEEKIKRDGFLLGFVLKPETTREALEKKIGTQAMFDRLERVGDAAEREPVPETAIETKFSVSRSRLSLLLDYMTTLGTTQAQLEHRISALHTTDEETERLFRETRRCTQLVQSLLDDISLIEIGQIFLQMKRLCRSLLKETGKKADITFTGGDVMVDKSVLEAINEALLHLLRNAVDHGIEPPEERLKAGKAEAGQITIAARQERARLIVAVSDDGGGIDREKILDKARKKGLLTKPEAEYTQEELYNFILQSGFSTKKAASQYSGRGVGLDAVYHAIQKTGGTMQLSSNLGTGTTITLNMPFSLSVMETLCMEADGRELYVPFSVIHKIVAGDGGEVTYHPNGDAVIGGEIYRSMSLETVHDVKMLVLFRADGHLFYLPCHSIGRQVTVLTKKLPLCAERLLGDDNIYLGYHIDRTGTVRCILDADRMIRRSQALQKDQRGTQK